MADSVSTVVSASPAHLQLASTRSKSPFSGVSATTSSAGVVRAAIASKQSGAATSPSAMSRIFSSG
ncbi:hypothetical protein [Parasphingopyxis sp.]|uniref:hypothetical protein n=1 Tax=Parasphingopyxis sp. TaxID=1920299 RepID=UPI003FA16F97